MPQLCVTDPTASVDGPSVASCGHDSRRPSCWGLAPAGFRIMLMKGAAKSGLPPPVVSHQAFASKPLRFRLRTATDVREKARRRPNNFLSARKGVCSAIRKPDDVRFAELENECVAASGIVSTIQAARKLPSPYVVRSRPLSGCRRRSRRRFRTSTSPSVGTRVSTTF